jgi:hypothetical protein
MNYQIIQPPFTSLIFKNMSRKELKDYNDWFHEIMPERIKILISAIQSTPGYESWRTDFSPESLNLLGEWFFSQTETRLRTQQEIAEIEGKLKYPLPVSGEELSNKTFSLAIDIGMYLSEVFLRNHEAIQWSQSFGNKKNVDYGQPVLNGFGASAFNPVHIMVTLAYGFARKSKTGKRLREIYDYWSNLAEVGKRSVP